MSEIVTSFFIIAGGFFAFAAALGVLRLPDVLTRMHASTKAGTLGCGLILAAAALHFGDTGTVGLCVAAIVFLFLTAPVAAHMIGRAAYRTGVPLSDRTVIDEMAAGQDGAPDAAAAKKQPVNSAPP
ncbi:MAG: multicomponent Na+:H+ antiporter subunit G [Paracoccaceae bacterium]|jgi:multicomponent Na+:H+ antiporter subunit G